MNIVTKKYENIKSKVNRVVYYNAPSKWGVLSIDNTINDENFKDTHITLTGNFEGVYEDCEIQFSGELTDNARYGTQILLSSIQVIQNLSSKEGIINFLAKSAIKGISFQNALKIYNSFGDNSISIVLNDTDKILNISGIGTKTLDKVKTSVENYRRMESLIKYCSDLGIPYSVIYKLDKELGEKALETVKNDIYSALEHSENLSFKQIDTIAMKMGIAPNDIKRGKACLKYTLKNLSAFNSSTGVANPELSKAFYKELGINNDSTLFNLTLNTLIENKDIIVENNISFLKEFYNTEKYIADMIIGIANRSYVKGTFNKEIIEEEIKNFPFQLNKEQVESIKKCLINNISVITAPPGAGKTTISKALVNIYSRHDYNVILLAPTGKATRRLEECTGRSALTIHKFLMSDTSFLKHEKSLILIDESSMMDIMIFADLLSVIGNDTKLILVGDIDQLPSVQAGNILEDLIKSSTINVCRLTEIVRQKADSTIIQYCRRINEGYPIELCNKADFIFEEFEDDLELTKSLIRDYCKEIDEYGIDNVQILTPYKIGNLGTNNINKLISDKVNKNKPDILFNFKLGDKVMQIVNNYDKDVFNGETGVVSSISDTLKVDFDGNIVEYEYENLDELILAYSCSVHKSQGSEYPVVFVVLDDSQTGFLLLRKILYTAVSRGKQKVYIYSKPYCVDRCVNNSYYKERITKLKEFLKQYRK